MGRNQASLECPALGKSTRSQILALSRCKDAGLLDSTTGGLRTPADLGVIRDAGDHRDFVPAIDVTMNRSLTYGRPGFGRLGNQEEPGLVGKH